MKWEFLFARPTSALSLRPLPAAIPDPGGLQHAGQSVQAKARKYSVRSLSRLIFDSRLASTSYFEIIVLAGLLPAVLMWWAQPEAQALPFLFTVLMLIPLLMGLHYGFYAATSSSLLMMAVFGSLVYLKPGLLNEFPKAQSIGLLLVGMCAGEAHDIWENRLQRVTYLCKYHRTRLEQFSSAYQLLRVSHTQLERTMAGGASSLRAALEQLMRCEPPSDAAQHEPLGGIGLWLLDIMAEAGNLHAAAVYEINAKGILRLPPVAMVGKAADLSPFNPLLRETLRTGSLTSVHAAHEPVHEHVIAIVPLTDATGHIHGVVVIYDMPFLNVHQETFELLGVLGRHAGDIVARRVQPMGATQDRFVLRENLARNLAETVKYGLPAALVACKVVDAACRDFLMAQCSRSRGLDQSWTAVNRSGESVMVKLLLLTDESGVKSYLARLNTELAVSGGAVQGIATYHWMLDGQRTADALLTELCAVCDLDAMPAKPLDVLVAAVL